MSPEEAKSEQQESTEMPDNLKELIALLNIVDKLIQVFDYQQKETTSDAEKKGLQRKIDNLFDITKALQNLQTRLIETKSQDELLAFAEKKLERLREYVNSAPTKSIKNERGDELIAMNDAIVFITKERQYPSDLFVKRELVRFVQKEAKAEKAAAQEKTSQDSEQGENLREKILIDSINNNGRGNIHMSLPAKYAPKKTAGFQTFGDKNWHQQPVMDSTISDRMRKENIREVVVLKPWKKWTLKKEVVSPAKKGFLGIGARKEQTRKVPAGERDVLISELIDDNTSNEAAYKLTYLASGEHDEDYRDSSKRPGQVLFMEIAVPRSIAEKVRGRLEKDPTFIRRLAKARLEKHFKENGVEIDFEKVWKNGDENSNGVPLSPPYDLWDIKGRKIELL